MFFSMCVMDETSKSVRSPAATESLSLCVAKEKVTKEKGHPAWRLPGILPGKSVSRGRAFRTGILPVRKGTDIPVGSRCAACRPQLTAAQGPRVEQRAILARTRYATTVWLRELKKICVSAMLGSSGFLRALGMMTRGSGSLSVAVRFEVLEGFSATRPWLDEVCSASDAHRNELGFLARSVFEQFARRDDLYVLLAQTPTGSQYAGHLLFDRHFPRAHVRQMFILESFRRNGAASQLPPVPM